MKKPSIAKEAIMKLSLVLATLLLSSTALASSFEIECFDETNTKLFTITSPRPNRTSVVWASGSMVPVNFSKTESVTAASACFDNHSLELKLKPSYQSADFDILIASHWGEGEPMTRCAFTGLPGLFEGTMVKEGKTIALTCNQTSAVGL